MFIKNAYVSYKHEVYIANTLKYIHLLPEKEQKKSMK